VVVLALIGLSAFAGDGSAPRLAFAAGGAMYVAAYWLPRASAVLLVAALVMIQVSAPRLLSTDLPRTTSDHSLWHRMEVWALAGELIAARPLLGYGFSNSSVIPAQAGTLPLTGERRVIPMYPHNVLLQVRLELGIPGVMGFYGALVYVLWRLMAFPALVRAAGLAMVAAALSVWCVGYPLWRSTWLAWLWFGAIAWSAITEPEVRACPAS
jgi:O-antigen ligase